MVQKFVVLRRVRLVTEPPEYDEIERTLRSQLSKCFFAR